MALPNPQGGAQLLQPNQHHPAFGLPFPTINTILGVPLANGRPTATCWRLSTTPNQQVPDNRLGQWTTWTQDPATSPPFTNLDYVIIVFSRASSLQTVPERCHAANAIVAARIHRELRVGNQASVMQGRTLVLLSHMQGRAGFPMPAFQPPPPPPGHGGRDANIFPKFIELMEGLNRQYGNVLVKPNLVFVSRSMSSVTILLNIGWLGFLNRFGTWQQHILLVYQVRNAWPGTAADPGRDPTDPQGHRAFVPWTIDPVYPIKFYPVNLRQFITDPTPQNPQPPWWRTLKDWIQEEYDARWLQMPAARQTLVLRVRGTNRLQVM